MTDGATGNSGGGRLELGPSADELFADFKTRSRDDRSRREMGGGDVEDRTAADVFGQLQADVDGAGANGTGVDDLLDGETPEDIIASADEPDPEPEIDDDLLADEGELEALLLTDRVADEEFLWIDTGDATDDQRADASDDSSASDVSTSGGLVLMSMDDIDEYDDFDEHTDDEYDEYDDFDDEETGSGNAGDGDDEHDDADSSDESSGVVGRFRSKLPF